MSNYRRHLRSLLAKNKSLEAYAKELKRQVVNEQSRLGNSVHRLADNITGPAPVLSMVRGKIGVHDAELVWHFDGWPSAGFDVHITSPENRTIRVYQPQLTLENLKPETAYLGEIRSLDNPHSSVPFGFWTRPDSVTGYVLPISAEAGREIELFVSSSSPEVNIIMRPLLDQSAQIAEWTLQVPFQYAPYDSSAYGCNWEPTLRIVLPEDIASGVYVFDLQAVGVGPRYSMPVIVRPKSPPPLAVVCSTDTWNAYNNWGGNSFYDNFIGAPEPLWASQARPPFLVDPWSAGANYLGAEAHVLRFFGRHGIEIGVYSDEDLADGRIGHCKTLVLMGHNEYWCDNKVAELDRLLAAGTNVVVLSGNTLYRRTIRDSIRHASSRFAIFPDEEVCKRLGVVYTAAGRETGAPYRVVNPEHWIFEGCGVSAGTIFGQNDTPVYAASGIETDKRTRFSPSNAEMIAQGTNEVGGAEWVIYRNQFGGLIMNAGSMTVAVNVHDPVIERMLLNVLAMLEHAPKGIA